MNPPETVKPAQSPRFTRQEGANNIATLCTHELLEMGLPDKFALLARDIVALSIPNYGDRLMAGEWE